MRFEVAEFYRGGEFKGESEVELCGRAGGEDGGVGV